jgi:hypothetical protein
LSEIRPRLRAFFSSRFVIVDVGQSPGASLVTATEVSGVTFFDAAVVALGPVVLATRAGCSGGALLLDHLGLQELWWFGAAALRAIKTRCKNKGRRRWQEKGE